MEQKINKRALPVVVTAVSVLSIVLLYRLVWAQFVSPDSQPGDTIGVGITVNPMAADLDLNGWTLVDNVADLGSKLGLIEVETPADDKAALYADFRGTAGGYAIFAKNYTGTGAAAYFDANGSPRLAGYFNGDVRITGDLTVDGSGGGGGASFWQAGAGADQIYYGS